MPKSAPPTIAPTLVPLTALHPAPWNPRTIRDVRFKNLCASLQADPDFLWQRPLLADEAGEIYAGNMRWRAAAHLGWTEVPAILGPVDPLLARARGLRDNNAYGEWEYEALAGLITELQAADMDLETLGFPASELEPLLAATWTAAAVDEAALFDRAGEAPGLGKPIVVTLEQRETINRAIARVRQQCGDPDTSEGRCIELACADWLSGQATQYEREHARADH